MAENNSLLTQTGADAYYGERTEVSLNSSLGSELDAEISASSTETAWENPSQAVSNATSANSGFSDFLGMAKAAGGGDTMDAISQHGGSAVSKLGTIFGKINQFMGGALLYKDGVSETSFGGDMSASWEKFFNAYQKSFSKDTPLGSANSADSVYGNLILGTPPLYTDITDPNHRSTLNTFVKDMRFLSLTPGLPKYNGGYIDQLTTGSHYKNQTKSPSEMIEYLRRNGIDSDFANKDRRYYTFQTKYDEYYAYLETMLNVVWIKMGLGEEGDGNFNLMTFFNGDGPLSDLQTQYKTPLGFYIQGAPQISEDINNMEFDSGLANDINSKSDEFQRINYITGMGTASGVMGGVKTAARAVNNTLEMGRTIKSSIIDPVMEGVSFKGGVKGILKGAAQLALNIANFSSTNDMSALVQQFMVTNGMKVRYPNLWGDSQYSKNMNFDFDFISPYGDPLSIFHYVYVPFFALLTFAMPRQADENGFVSPFFVRGDIPGHMVTDLALISNITWTKGGSSGNLFTKDGLPRAIHVSITLTDLYPYLAMTKRMSFMSANPSYTVFLDSMAGLHSQISGQADDDYLNEHFKAILKRIDGNESSSGLKNNYGASLFKKARIGGYNNSKAVPVGGNRGTFSTSWLTLKKI